MQASSWGPACSVVRLQWTCISLKHKLYWAFLMFWLQGLENSCKTNLSTSQICTPNKRLRPTEGLFGHSWVPECVTRNRSRCWKKQLNSQLVWSKKRNRKTNSKKWTVRKDTQWGGEKKICWGVGAFFLFLLCYCATNVIWTVYVVVSCECCEILLLQISDFQCCYWYFVSKKEKDCTYFVLSIKNKTDLYYTLWLVKK